ncbi:MAG TPA: class I SAM-dependent methyltransferase [Gammaproteobacteria bacterium]|nr:class I SAM-dependent methyltransferase [Gammaproteobacteria bacterium]
MKTRRKRSLAARADRYRLYERSVQDADAEAEFLKDNFRRVRGRAARSLREDFCGTARLACEWVLANPRHRAIGVDLDPEVLGWGREHNVARLSDAQRARLRLVQADVREAPGRRLDLVAAMNFSYWIFRERETLAAYFASIRRALAPDGLFMLDAFGGSDAYDLTRERRAFNGFTYIWEQAEFDPITARSLCYIHFRFRDGSRLNRAFSYEWRLWTLPEIRELLAEAGFSRSTVLWQGTDEKTGDVDGDFVPAERGEPDPSWIAYVQAEP